MARDTGNEYARLAAVIREEIANEKIDGLTERLGAAELDRDAWKATPRIAERNDLAERRATLREAVRAAEKDAAPLEVRRAETAAGARAGPWPCAPRGGRPRRGARRARRAVERYEAELAAARKAEVLGPDEKQTAAAARLEATDEHDATREVELAEAIQQGRAVVARDRDARDPLVLSLVRTCWYFSSVIEGAKKLSYKLIHRQGPWRSVDEVELATARRVPWWNRQQLHGSCGDIPPAEFEAAYRRRLEAPIAEA